MRNSKLLLALGALVLTCASGLASKSHKKIGSYPNSIYYYNGSSYLLVLYDPVGQYATLFVTQSTAPQAQTPINGYKLYYQHSPHSYLPVYWNY